jgi:glycosyltransferase involved in cell wall biosynthesis
VDILEAFEEVAERYDARLIMVGEGPEFGLAVERVKQSPTLRSHVQLVGAQADVRPFLWQADVFVLASDNEGAPLVLLEAMACGVPWISTAWGVAAIVPSGECGLVVAVHSPGELANAMSELIVDPARRARMAARARQLAITEFGEARYVADHIQVLQDVERGAPLDRK